MKGNKVVIGVLFICIMGLVSCQNKKELNAKEMIKWVENKSNGLVKSKEVGEFYFEAKFRPQVYENALAISRGSQELENNDQDDFYYITLKIGTQTPGMNITEWKASDAEKIQKNIYYLSFGMQNHIKLMDGEEMLDCVHYVFERSFGLSDFRIFNLGFNPSNWNIGDKTLVIEGDFFDVPPIKLKFKEDDLKRIPLLADIGGNEHNKLNINTISSK